MVHVCVNVCVSVAVLAQRSSQVRFRPSYMDEHPPFDEDAAPSTPCAGKRNALDVAVGESAEKLAKRRLKLMCGSSHVLLQHHVFNKTWGFLHVLSGERVTLQCCSHPGCQLEMDEDDETGVAFATAVGPDGEDHEQLWAAEMFQHTVYGDGHTTLIFLNGLGPGIPVEQLECDFGLYKVGFEVGAAATLAFVDLAIFRLPSIAGKVWMRVESMFELCGLQTALTRHRNAWVHMHFHRWSRFIERLGLAGGLRRSQPYSDNTLEQPEVALRCLDWVSATPAAMWALRWKLAFLSPARGGLRRTAVVGGYGSESRIASQFYFNDFHLFAQFLFHFQIH